ncbi:MAG TPA: c-type cytochrome [Silvibacterium sp.]|nr:c-type cytochrome [Silvibacterium sp.]
MKKWVLFVAVLVSGSALCFAAANGAWLKKIPAADRRRVNPYAGSTEAVAAGGNLYRDNCAKCHGTEAQGRSKHPSLRSERLKNATDGEIAWIIKNGQMYKGMPSWGGLPEQERWQIVAYLRCLNAAVAALCGPPAGGLR